MKIVTDRPWDLKIRMAAHACTELREDYRLGYDADDSGNYVLIPNEAIPELIKYLLKRSKKTFNQILEQGDRYLEK